MNPLNTPRTDPRRVFVIARLASEDAMLDSRTTKGLRACVSSWFGVFLESGVCQGKPYDVIRVFEKYETILYKVSRLHT